MSEAPTWKKEVESLASSGETQKVFDVLLAAAQAGDVLARIVLAEKYWMAQRYAESDQEIELAEKLVQPDDSDAHWYLYGAYTVGLLSDQTFERWRRAFLHLRIAAELDGDPRLYMKVGSHYWSGLNGVDVDLDQAEQWLSDAASTGYGEAVAKYEEFKRWRQQNGPNENKTVIE